MAITPNPTLLWFVIVYCLIMVILGSGIRAASQTVMISSWLDGL